MALSAFLRILNNSVLPITALASLCSLFSFSNADKATRFLCIFIMYTGISECVAYVMAVTIRENYMVLTIYDFAELILLCLYFNYSIPALRKHNYGIWIAALVSLIGLINDLFIETDSGFKLNFTLVITIIFIILSFYSMFSIVIKKKAINLRNNIHFLFAAIIMVYMSCDFLYWGLYNVILKSLKYHTDAIFHITHVSATILFYLAYCITLLHFLHTQQKNNEPRLYH